jgi:polysaccharide biosynthesis/export protein
MSIYRYAGFVALLCCVSMHGQVTRDDAARLSPSQEEYPSNTNVLPEETLGANDLLEIMIPYCPELSRSFRISGDGKIVLPLLKKKLSVTGLTPTQLATNIGAELKAEEVLADPVVNVSVLEYRSHPVSVVGAVNHPLTFQATGSTTLLEAIAKAGGLAPNAGADILVVKKELSSDGNTQENVQPISAKELIESSDRNKNIALHGGEEIRVPESSKFFVTGNVRRPGMYPMQANSDTTVLKALALSEGIDSFTSKNAYIYRLRKLTQDRDEVQIPLSRIMARKAPDVKLCPDDILYVPSNNGRRLTSRVISQITSFGQNTASGMMIYH